MPKVLDLLSWAILAWRNRDRIARLTIAIVSIAELKFNSIVIKVNSTNNFSPLYLNKRDGRKVAAVSNIITLQL